MDLQIFSPSNSQEPSSMDATALEEALLPSFAFNGIKSSEQQDQILKNEDLMAIADVYVRNQMHTEYGVGLLHRHTVLPERSVMIHRILDGSVDICEARSLDSLDHARLIANSLFLNVNDKFQAFEYDIEIPKDPRPTLHLEFLSQLRDLLIDRRLTGSIAIIPSPGDCVEYLLPEGRGTISIPYHQMEDKNLSGGEFIVTGWSFHENEDGSIECMANKKCNKQNTGLHIIVRQRDFALASSEPSAAAQDCNS